MGVVFTSGASLGFRTIKVVVPEVARLGCSICSLSCLSSTTGVFLGVGGSSDTSEDVKFFLGWSVSCWLGHSYSLPLLNEMTLQVSMFFVPNVDVDVLVELGIAPIGLEIGSLFLA